MFERIKCYKNLKKADKFLYGTRRLGEITNNEEMIRESNECIYNNAILRKKMWFNRRMAENYNLEVLKKGLN